MIVIGALVWSFYRQYPARKEIRNVLLISIDTCRADHLSCYGYTHATTPNIDAVAREGVLFSHVLSPVPMTLPAHSSMMTGTIPPYHGVHLNLDYQLAQSAETLAEVFKRHGSTTGAVVSAFVLDSQFGLAQGFDTYYDHFDPGVDGTPGEERKADEANRYAMDWLAEHRNDPFFLFLHYFDPHSPFEPPEPFASRFPDNPYAGEIAYADHCIGQVLGKLKEWGLYDSTLIVITADHGEMLGEHGEPFHGYFIYEAAVKVPLILKLPGHRPSRRVNELVGLVDIVPTVCGLLGMKPESDLQGMDLSDCVRNGTHPEQGRHLYCESLMATSYDAGSLLGLVTDRWKYIQTTRPELYDLASDPGEFKNLVEVEADRAADMRARIQETIEKQHREDSASRLELGEQDRKRLESLGYVGGGSTQGAFTFDTSKDDPKDLVGFHKSAQELAQLCSKKRYAEAKVLCERLLQQRPAYVGGHKHMGEIAVAQSDYAGAILHFRRVLELSPNDIFAHHNLGTALREEGKLEEAIVHYQRVLEARPDFAEAHNNMGIALSMQGRLDGGIGHFRQALQLEPDHAELHNNLGNALRLQSRVDEAISHYRRTLQIKPGYVDAHWNLADLLRSQGKLSEAILHYRQVLQLRPDDAEAHHKLALTLVGTGRPGEALEHFQEAEYLRPDWPVPLNEMAWILATRPEGIVRDGRRAVELARRASELAHGRNAAILDTLAAAYAEAGEFELAVTTAQEAIKLASAAETKGLAETIGRRLELYRQGKPYREPLPGGGQREGP